MRVRPQAALDGSASGAQEPNDQAINGDGDNDDDDNDRCDADDEDDED